MPDLTTSIIMLAVVCAIYLLYRTATGKSRVYRNALKLSGIPRIKELKARTAWSFGARADEFIYIADTIEEWQLERKSVADYVQDEAHRMALLKDLAFLKRQTELDLMKERQKPPNEQARKFVRRRDVFIKNVDIEIARLQGWKPSQKEERVVSFREFNVKAVCFFSGDGTRKIVTGGTISFFEEGDFIIKQEMIETAKTTELARVKVMKANIGETIHFSLNSPESSRLVIYEQRTRREEKRVL